MRIIFVMKCQDVLKPLSRKQSLKKYLSLRFKNYTYDDEYTFIKVRDKFYNFLSTTFSSKEPEIKLDDPQKKLEDNLTELARATNDDLKTIREVLTNHITDVATKLGNAQQRLEDSLLENSRKSTNNIESSQDNFSSQIGDVEKNLTSSQNQIKYILKDIHRNTNTKLVGLKNAFKTRFEKLETKFIPPQKDLEDNVGKLFKQTGNIIKISNTEFKNVTNLLNGIVIQMDEFININKALCNQVNRIQDITDNLVTKMSTFQLTNSDLLNQINGFQNVNASLALKINDLEQRINQMNYEVKDLNKNNFVTSNRKDTEENKIGNNELISTINIPSDFEIKYKIVKEQVIKESSGSEDE
jgi:hypothetical protein